MKYIYSAQFETGEDGTVYARIPDLPGCITTGSDLSDAITQITDAANCWLVVAEDAQERIPAPTPQSLLPHAPNVVYSLIRLDTLAYRAATDSRAVRKNVSLPAWMAAMADRCGLNCSQILQESLTARFNAL